MSVGLRFWVSAETCLPSSCIPVTERLLKRAINQNHPTRIKSMVKRETNSGLQTPQQEDHNYRNFAKFIQQILHLDKIILSAKPTRTTFNSEQPTANGCWHAKISDSHAGTDYRLPQRQQIRLDHSGRNQIRPEIPSFIRSCWNRLDDINFLFWLVIWILTDNIKLD